MTEAQRADFEIEGWLDRRYCMYLKSRIELGIAAGVPFWVIE